MNTIADREKNILDLNLSLTQGKQQTYKVELKWDKMGFN